MLEPWEPGHPTSTEEAAEAQRGEVSSLSPGQKERKQRYQKGEPIPCAETQNFSVKAEAPLLPPRLWAAGLVKGVPFPPS